MSVPITSTPIAARISRADRRPDSRNTFLSRLPVTRQTNRLGGTGW